MYVIPQGQIQPLNNMEIGYNYEEHRYWRVTGRMQNRKEQVQVEQLMPLSIAAYPIKV